MAITSELIGKLGGGGGAGVEVIPVSGTASGNSRTTVLLHTVEVPAGETWLVALYGNLQGRYSGAPQSPQLYIGDTALPEYAPNGTTLLAHVGTGTIDVKLYRNTSAYSDSFTGHVYTFKV